MRLANRGRLLLRTPGPVPIGTCICSNVETILSWTCHVSGPFEFRTSLGTSILLCRALAQFRGKTSCISWRHNSISQVFAAKAGKWRQNNGKMVARDRGHVIAVLQNLNIQTDRQSDGRAVKHTDGCQSDLITYSVHYLKGPKELFPKTTCKCEHKTYIRSSCMSNSAKLNIDIYTPPKKVCTTWTIFKIFLKFCKLLEKLIMFIDQILIVMSSDRISDKTWFILFY